MKWLIPGQIREPVFTTLAIFAIYCFTSVFVWVLVAPAQQDILPEITPYASLIFLPHGVRVFATALVGVRALPGLLLGEVAGNYLLWDVTHTPSLFLASVAGGLACWLAFEMLRRMGVNAYYLRVDSSPPPLRSFLLAGIAASAFNAFFRAAVFEATIPPGEVTAVIAACLTGDVAGLLLFIILAKLAVLLFPAQ
jgi:hypothetical protein